MAREGGGYFGTPDSVNVFAAGEPEEAAEGQYPLEHCMQSLAY